MIEIFCSRNIDDLIKDPDNEAFCVTTNGVIKRNGKLVMGKGIAKYVSDTYPDIASMLADHVRKNGNIPVMAKFRSKKDGVERLIISLPTKNDWRDNSDIRLIRKSLNAIVDIADETQLDTIYLTRPGCGCGGLCWERDVKPVAEDILDDRFIVASSDDR